MKRPLRVAVLADSFPPRGHSGVGNSHHHLIGALREAGLDVEGFAFLEIPKPLSLALKAALRGPLHLLAFLRRPWRRPGLALELSNNVSGALNGLRVLKRIKAFDPDWVIAPDFGAPAALWPLAWRRRLVLVAHSNPLRFLDQPLIGLRDPLDARLAWRLEARMSAEAAAVVAPSDYMRAVFEKDYPHRARPRLIRNLLMEDLLEATPKSPPPAPGPRTWVFIPAADNVNKGRQYVPALLEGLARRMPGRRIGFVLSGSVGPAMRRSLGGLPGNAVVHSPGTLPYAENIGLMKACQICVSPTLIENFGMALLEAQFCGLPVLTFDVGGNAELVADGRTGRIVPYLDVEALARESAGLLMDPARLARWGRAAARRARREFSSRSAGRAYVRLLRGLKRP
jgi:glycosyltransferase involved in cell wall biosynthesis